MFCVISLYYTFNKEVNKQKIKLCLTVKPIYISSSYSFMLLLNILLLVAVAFNYIRHNRSRLVQMKFELLNPCQTTPVVFLADYN